MFSTRIKNKNEYNFSRFFEKNYNDDKIKFLRVSFCFDKMRLRSPLVANEAEKSPSVSPDRSHL